MRTYNQAVSKIANRAFSDELGGGYGQYSGIDMVSFIFGKTAARVNTDVDKMLADIKTEYYRKYEKEHAW